MYESCNKGLQALVLASVLSGVTSVIAQPTPMGSNQGPGSAPIEKIIPSPAVVDTITESADKQRAARRSALLSKVGGPIVPNATQMPAIQVNEISGPDSSSKAHFPNQEKGDQYMVLSEVLRSSVKSIAGITIFGTTRHVVAGDDLGNGWKVASVDRFKVTLTEVPALGKKVSVGPKTRVLLLGTPPKLDVPGQFQPQPQISGMRP